jgi:hypothetical protein
MLATMCIRFSRMIDKNAFLAHASILDSRPPFSDLNHITSLDSRHHSFDTRENKASASLPLA